MSNKDKIDYLDLQFNENVRPHTSFPFNLTKYLVDRFHLEKGSKVLDIGCGRCEVLDAFTKLGLDISGIDSSERIRDFAPKTISKLEILDFSKENIPFDDDEFDFDAHNSTVSSFNFLMSMESTKEVK